MTSDTGLPVRHITSTCHYIEQMAGGTWNTPTIDGALVFGEHAGARWVQQYVPQTRFVRDWKQDYAYRDLLQFPCMIHIPYNCSVMSFFEHYWLNIPLFVPSKQLLAELMEKKLALSQISFKWDHSGAALKPADMSRGDPNLRADMPKWFDLYDFYTLPHVTTFDSPEHLLSLLQKADFRGISARMAETNKQRYAACQQAWADAVEKVKAYGQR